MLKQKFSILLFFLVLLLTSCEKPSWVLSEKQMENVLFDIHIAEAEISDNYMDFRNEERKEDLYASVFKKHKITKEQFDTSLVWYGKNLDKYMGIYDELSKRYSILSDSITAKIDRQKVHTITSDSSRIYIWEGPTSFMLTSLVEKNTMSFDFDTIKLSPKDHYEFMFTALGITDSISAPTVTFGITFPDSLIVKRSKVTDNGLFTISIPSTDSIAVPSHIFGSIRIAPHQGDTKVLIYDIKLYKNRAHQ